MHFWVAEKYIWKGILNIFWDYMDINKMYFVGFKDVLNVFGGGLTKIY